jgi:hypothetical protein
MKRAQYILGIVSCVLLILVSIAGMVGVWLIPKYPDTSTAARYIILFLLLVLVVVLVNQIRHWMLEYQRAGAESGHGFPVLPTSSEDDRRG